MLSSFRRKGELSMPPFARIRKLGVDDEPVI